jgi:hypothetical protein
MDEVEDRPLQRLLMLELADGVKAKPNEFNSLE